MRPAGHGRACVGIFDPGGCALLLGLRLAGAPKMFDRCRQSLLNSGIETHS